MRTSILFGATAVFASAHATIVGFNYGNQKSDGSGLKVQSDYENEFTAAQNLAGTNGQYTSARLYTMLQSAPATDPISAIPAAIATKTSLLFGLWASAGDAAFATELQGLSNALSQYGTQLQSAGLIIGISVGSEDLYRDSTTGAGALPGADPATIVKYIGQVRTVVEQASLSIPVGHVDTWTAWVNGSNSDVITAVDFVGMDTYPYFQAVNDNSPGNLVTLFDNALTATENLAQGKPVWVTETGYPVTGPTYNLAVPSVATAHDYYHNIGCGQLFGQRNTWWYTLEDAPPAGQTDTAPSFGVVGYSLGTQPLYDLQCSNGADSDVSSSTTSSSKTSSSTTLTVQTTLTTSVSANSQPTSASCSTNLTNPFEFPHLLVPISSTNPDTAYGTQYDATINGTTSSLFNFDVSATNDAGKTCSLVFLWSLNPTNSAYTFNNQGGLTLSVLADPASVDTTWNNVPTATVVGSIPNASPGNNYVVTTGPCPAGETVGYRVDSSGGLSLEYFQEDSASGPIGLYITVC